MAAPSSLQFAQLLLAWSQGERAAEQEVIPLVHAELGWLAHPSEPNWLLTTSRFSLLL